MTLQFTNRDFIFAAIGTLNGAIIGPLLLEIYKGLTA